MVIGREIARERETEKQRDRETERLSKRHNNKRLVWRNAYSTRDTVIACFFENTVDKLFFASHSQPDVPAS